ncbi:unnamed protein product [Miscanthus lutarioriparius]|uniref:Uncharacterized protein n=1 Tax=Miscanthus lutarioriparius TaxID=422564 RepID=A0A811P4R0_9POAL|nr:unnamed protein product [Miscanthus lutarioriparius]
MRQILALKKMRLPEDDEDVPPPCFGLRHHGVDGLLPPLSGPPHRAPAVGCRRTAPGRKLAAAACAPTFKGRKQIENRRVVELGGKAVKKHRTPLSVAKPALKNQKKREQKKIEEEKLLGIFRKRDKNTKAHKTRPEDRVLRATEGRFKNGILDVKHLLAPPKPSGRDAPEPKMRKGKHKGKGKQKGGRRKRR